MRPVQTEIVKILILGETVRIDSDLTLERTGATAFEGSGIGTGSGPRSPRILCSEGCALWA